MDGFTSSNSGYDQQEPQDDRLQPRQEPDPLASLVLPVYQSYRSFRSQALLNEIDDNDARRAGLILQAVSAWRFATSADPGAIRQQTVRRLESIISQLTGEPALASTPAPINAINDQVQRYGRKAGYRGVSATGLNLSRLDLSGLDFTGSNLRNANLESADLSRANLINVDFSQANLRRARLNQAKLVASLLPNAQLEGADLVGANFSGANLQGANLAGARLGDKLNGAIFLSADLRAAKLNRAILINTNFADADFTGADLSDLDLSTANFQRANLSQAIIRNTAFGLGVGEGRFAKLENGLFKEAVLDGADVTGSEYQLAPLVRVFASAKNLVGDTRFVGNINAGRYPLSGTVVIAYGERHQLIQSIPPVSKGGYLVVGGATDQTASQTAQEALNDAFFILEPLPGTKTIDGKILQSVDFPVGSRPHLKWANELVQGQYPKRLLFAGSLYADGNLSTQSTSTNAATEIPLAGGFTVNGVVTTSSRPEVRSQNTYLPDEWSLPLAARLNRLGANITSVDGVERDLSPYYNADPNEYRSLSSSRLPNVGDTLRSPEPRLSGENSRPTLRTLVRAVPLIRQQGQVPIVSGLGEAPQLDTEFNAIDNYLSLRQAGVTPYTFGTPSSAGGARRIGDVARELRSRFSDSDFKPIYQTEDGAIYPNLEAVTKSVISDRLEKIQLEIVDPDDRARLNSSDKRTQQEFQQALKLASDLLDKADIGKAQDPIAATKEFLGRLKKIKESEGFLLHGLAVPFNKVQTPRQRGLLLDAISIIERSNLYSAPGLGQIGSKIQKTTAKGLGKNVAGATLRAGLTDLANIALQSAGTALVPATGGMSLPAFYGLSVLTSLGLNAPSYEQEQALRIEILLSQARATGAILSDDGRDILNVTPIEGEQFVLNAPLPFKATKELKDMVGGKLGAGGIGYRKTGQSTLNVGVSDWNTLPPGTVLSRLDVLKLSDAMYAAVPYKPAKTLDFDRVEERATFYLGAERGNSIVPNPWDNIQRYNADSEASTYLEMLSANQGSPLRQAIINAMSTQFIGKTVANFQPGVTRAKNFVFDPVQGLVSLYKTAAGPGSNLITGAVNQLFTGWTNGVTRLVNVSTQTANEIKFKRATFPASFRPYFERLAEVQQSTGLKIENDTVQAVANSGDTKVYAALTQLIERFAQNSAEAEAAGLKNQLQVDMNQAARDIASARFSPEYLIRNLENTNLKLNQILDINDDRRAVYEAYTSVPDDIPGTLRQRINLLQAYYERRGRPQSQLDKLDRLTTQQLSDLVMRFTGLPLPQSLESNNNTLLRSPEQGRRSRRDEGYTTPLVGDTLRSPE
ncbi:MAG: pentapeptide repeat-containing protein, partial [Burkholderiales bacterium]|nr:pentapeptide repeat-containing protein [Burkholderiales bacterium]